MTINQIKQAVDRGDSVKWASDLYDVIKDSRGQYLIECNLNGSCIGLTYRDGTKLNGKECQFYIKKRIV